NAAGMGAVLGLQTNIGLARALGQAEIVRTPPGVARNPRRRFTLAAPKTMKNRMSANELWHRSLHQRPDRGAAFAAPCRPELPWVSALGLRPQPACGELPPCNLP